MIVYNVLIYSLFTFMDPQLPIQNCFKMWVHYSTRGVEGYLMNFHGPRKDITFQKLVY